MRVIVRGEPYPLYRITMGEAAAIERVTGKTFEALMQGGGSLVGTQALVWLAMKRSNPTMRFSDTDDIAVDDISIELDEAENETPLETTTLPDVTESFEG